MSTRIYCDGCGGVLVTREEFLANGDPGIKLRPALVVIQGSRVDGTVGDRPIPQGDFHLCERCAKVAFQAVEELRLRIAGLS